MTPLYAPQDVGAIRGLAGVLSVPALAVAAMLEWGFAFIVSQAWPAEIGSLSVPWVQRLSIAILFFAFVTGVAALHNLAEQLLAGRPKLFYLMGLSLIAFGLLGLGEYAQVPSPFKINFFWHFGCLCWGIDVFRPTGKSAEA